MLDARSSRASMLAFAALILLVSTAVAVRLGLSAIEIRMTTSPAPTLSALPSGVGDRLATLDLGVASSLVEARRRASFAITMPAGMGPPDRLFLRDIEGAGVAVSLVYDAVAGWPAPPTTGVSLLITEMPGSVDEPYMAKLINTGNDVTPVPVQGGHGYWISGMHQFLFLHPTLPETSIPVRLAGDTLIWEHDDVAYRLETGASMQSTASLADTFSP